MDVEGLGLTNYRQVIRTPMDLGTIRNRLAPGARDDAACVPPCLHRERYGCKQAPPDTRQIVR